jgi:hypothetical protein
VVNAYLKIAVFLGLLVVPALLMGQGLPRWAGALTGIGDYDGSQFSSAHPFPMKAVPGTYANGGVALSTSPVQVFAANPARVRLVLINNSGLGTAGGTAIMVWCRWGTVAGAPAAAGGVGSFAVQPNGGGRDDNDSGVNQNALNCLSESGAPTIYAEQY